MKTTKKHIIRNSISVTVLVLAAAVMPLVALAQSTSGTSSCTSTQASLCTLISDAIGYFNQAIYLIIGLAIVTFVWNVYHYFIVSDPENKKEASKYVMFSVIGLFVILSFWGLVNIVSNTLNLDTTPAAINITNLTGSGSTGTTGGAGTYDQNDNLVPGQSI